MIHIVVDKLSKLLVCPHVTFIWNCTKLVKCDYLTIVKLFDINFVSKYTLDTIGADQNIR